MPVSKLPVMSATHLQSDYHYPWLVEWQWRERSCLESRLVWQVCQTLSDIVGQSSYPLWHFEASHVWLQALDTDPGRGDGVAATDKTVPLPRNMINWPQGCLLGWILASLSDCPSEKTHLVSEDLDLWLIQHCAEFGHMQLSLITSVLTDSDWLWSRYQDQSDGESHGTAMHSMANGLGKSPAERWSANIGLL